MEKQGGTIRILNAFPGLKVCISFEKSILKAERPLQEETNG